MNPELKPVFWLKDVNIHEIVDEGKDKIFRMERSKYINNLLKEININANSVNKPPEPKLRKPNSYGTLEHLLSTFLFFTIIYFLLIYLKGK